MVRGYSGVCWGVGRFREIGFARMGEGFFWRTEG